MIYVRTPSKGVLTETVILGILPEGEGRQYKHFLYLAAAVRILLMEDEDINVDNNDLVTEAEHYMKYVVQLGVELYGRNFVTYNS